MFHEHFAKHRKPAQVITMPIYKFNKHNSTMSVEKIHLGTLFIFKFKEIYIMCGIIGFTGNLKYYNNKRDIPSTYFPIPKSIFNLGLTSGEMLVYMYLMYCEDRQTHQCYPSYSTIGDAVDMSNNTVKKHVKGLEKKMGCRYNEN